MHKIKLSPYAKIFYTEWLLNPDTSYNILSADQVLYGNLNVERLGNALKRYVAEHVLLNSHVQDINGELYWIKNGSIKNLEYSNSPLSTSELLNYVTHSFNLHNDEPLYRFKLLRISDDVYRFIIVFHHLVMDGISLNTGLFEEVSNYYNNENYVIQYSIQDQIKLITNLTDTLLAKLEQNKTKHKEFWRQQLSDMKSIDLSFLKLDRDSNQQNTAQLCNPIGEIRFSFGEEELAKLNQIKLKYEITPSIYSQCIFALLLNKYTGQERLAICYPIAIKEGIDFIYGSQVNLNLIPYQFIQNATIVDLFKQSREFFRLTTQDESKYGYYPIADITRETSSKKMLDIHFAQVYFRDKIFEFNGITKIETLSELSVDGVTKDMLLFEQEPTIGRLNYRVKYDKKAVDEGLLHNLIASYKKLFFEVLDDLLRGNTEKKLSDYQLLDQKQYQQVIYEFNQTEKSYLQNKTIHELFEDQAHKTPDNIAIVHKETKLTYQELNKKANQLANYLHGSYNIKPDDLIVLCLDKNEQMLIAILAVLKAGGAYVPLPADYPDNRIDYILKDAKPKIVLTNKKYQHRLKVRYKDVLAIDGNQLQKKISREEVSNPKILMHSDNLAYVIYTSGTTGNPKGVLQQHNNVMRLFTATNDWYRFTSKDVWTLFHSYAFDFTVWEIWGALLYGGKLVIPTIEQIKDPNLFYKLCYQEKITILNQTPQAFYQFIDIAVKHFNDNRLLNLRYVIFGGEALNFLNLRAWCNLYGYDQPKLINMYGITETTVHVTYKEIRERDIGRSSCIGTAIPDQKLFILDANLMPLPIGAIGELYVGGAGLARGYLNQPVLTEEKFAPNPFQTKEEKAENKNNRLYKTGDLVRRFPDGTLEYIGRNDLQVKIRGYRIELCEIENALIGYNGIKQAAILIKERITEHASDKYLIAYYVADKKLDGLRVQNYLAMQLPEYMLPAILIYLNKFPLTINGKLDKKALPEPKFENNDKYIPPSNEQERLICKAFAEILGIEKVSVHADFFRLGGDSLKTIALTSALQTNFDIKVSDIFNLRTPLRLAESLCFGKDMLRQKLEQVKLSYQKMQNKKCVINEQLKNKIDRYLKDVDNLQIDCSLQKPIFNVLLTGATGYLGCNILNQLLRLTNYNVFLLVRANSTQNAINRINKKFQFYFDKTLDDVYNSRVFVIKADIEKRNLGLLPKEYQTLTTKIDSVIHAAALVKHYGDYDKFYSANVQATINLLKLTKLTQLKDFHYISTYSLLVFGFIADNDEYIYTEDDLPCNLREGNNVYDKTKLEGERWVVKYRDYGVKSNIYRVGNLAFISKNCRVQDNIKDNAFFNWLKCLFKIKCISRDISMVEVSPVDFVAQAIVKLFDKKQLSDNIYHVANPYLLDLSDAFMNGERSPIKVLPMEQFIDCVIEHLNKNIYDDLIVKFLLRQGWLDGWDLKSTSSIQVLQDKTQRILEQLDVKWLPITQEICNKYFESLKLYME